MKLKGYGVGNDKFLEYMNCRLTGGNSFGEISGVEMEREEADRVKRPPPPPPKPPQEAKSACSNKYSAVD